MSGVLLAALRRVATWLRAWRWRAVLEVGRDCHIGAGCRFWAPRGIRVGKSCYLGREVTIETNASIGDYVLIANRVALVGRRDHEYSRIGVPVRFGRWVGGWDSDPAVACEEVVVGSDVWLGFGCIVLSGVSVGRGAIVAAGSVVVSDVAPYAIVGGVPARELGRRFSSREAIEKHEAGIASGRFRSSERGYKAWTVEPGGGG